MKRWSLLAIGLGAYALALIDTAPVTSIDAGLQRISHGKLRLVEAKGTLWSGSGQIEIRDSGGRTGVAKGFAWRIPPESLLRGHLVCEVELEQATKSLNVAQAASSYSSSKQTSPKLRRQAKRFSALCVLAHRVSSAEGA